MKNLARSRGDRLFDLFNILLFAFVSLIVIYPLYFMIIASFSDPQSINSGAVWLLPQDITFEGYSRILNDPNIWLGYRNSIFYTIVGTAINVALIIPAGYALSRRDLLGRNPIIIFIVFTMFFNGGLIPTYLVVKNLGMLDTIWALILPSAVGVYNLIICRTYFQSTIPDALYEAAAIDGSTNTGFFFRVVLPLSLPIIAVMVLFHVVMHWNSYFPALIYLKDEVKRPLQLILREILIISQQQDNMVVDSESIADQQRIAELVKYGVVIVASLPVLVLYPFLQKYFVKGVMIGSIKG
ncbi:carbohydrate ABC transporter permease [Paenibacillus sp. PL2-23]|uniref:carbohydrate ABC transporter permease n=1 Tax=Paenibacillus sp. PL2-23 TaxID=2100729 RepID=UPI0030F9F5A4